MVNTLILNKEKIYEVGKYISLKTNNGTGYGGLLKRLTAEGLVIDQKYFDFEDVSSVDGYQCKHLKVVEVWG